MTALSMWCLPYFIYLTNCPVEARFALGLYNTYLAEEDISKENNVTRFGELVLCYTSEFEIHKNIVNVFVLKKIYAKS